MNDLWLAGIACLVALTGASVVLQWLITRCEHEIRRRFDPRQGLTFEHYWRWLHFVLAAFGALSVWEIYKVAPGVGLVSLLVLTALMALNVWTLHRKLRRVRSRLKHLGVKPPDRGALASIACRLAAHNLQFYPEHHAAAWDMRARPVEGGKMADDDELDKILHVIWYSIAERFRLAQIVGAGSPNPTADARAAVQSAAAEAELALEHLRRYAATHPEDGINIPYFEVDWSARYSTFQKAK